MLTSHSPINKPDMTIYLFIDQQMLQIYITHTQLTDGESQSSPPELFFQNSYKFLSDLFFLQEKRFQKETDLISQHVKGSPQALGRSPLPTGF